LVVESARVLADWEDRVHQGFGVGTETSFTLERDQTVPLLDYAGRGTIAQLGLRLTAQGPSDLRSLVLRMYWENATTPAIELPLSAFFGAELALADFRTLPLASTRVGSDVQLEANWPMPYFTHARITLTNSSSEARAALVRIAHLSDAPKPAAGHLHATWNQRRAPFQVDERYPVAALKGHGKYVGALVYMQGVVDPSSATPYPLGFLEGDERIVVDGTTCEEGTGTEDYFDAGWYWNEGRFDAPFATLISREEDQAMKTGSVTAARWHALTIAIEFESSFELSFEYGANRPQSATDYASVAFYYLFDP
jgi:hypothetical protein